MDNKIEVVAFSAVLPDGKWAVLGAHDPDDEDCNEAAILQHILEDFPGAKITRITATVPRPVIETVEATADA